MSMSTYIIGFRPPNDEWTKMKRVYDTCVVAGVGIPNEVDDFFNGEKPDPAGVEVNIKSALEEYHDNCSSGFQVDLQKLPKGIKFLRFVNSW